MSSKAEVKGHGNGLPHASKAAAKHKKIHAGHGSQSDGCPQKQSPAQGGNKY